MELMQRIMHMVKTGTITNKINTDNTIQACQVTSVQGQEVHNDRPMYGNWGMTSVPPTGSQAITLAGYGLNNNKIVVATHDVNTHPQNLKEGEVQMYDTKGQCIYLQDQTAITVKANNEVTITIGDTEMVTIRSGSLTVNKSLLAMNGATGYFSDQNGKLITVQAGIITDIS